MRVVAGALLRERQGGTQVLLARRLPGTHQGGLWEFPGGKVERGEDASSALARELHEEIGVTEPRADSLIRFPYRYPEFRMDFEVFRVTDWHGEVRPMLGQELRWVALDRLYDMDTPPASHTVLRALRLPRHYAITPDPADSGDWDTALEHLLQEEDIRLLQLRAHSLQEQEYRACARRVVAVAHEHGVQVLLNAPASEVLACGADGVHLNGNRLRQLRTRPLSPDLWVAASCHGKEDLEHARSIDADFAVLSRPGKPGSCDAEFFASHTARTTLPVYAIGSLRRGDCERMVACGGQGIAAVRGFWEVFRTDSRRVRSRCS